MTDEQLKTIAASGAPVMAQLAQCAIDERAARNKLRADLRNIMTDPVYQLEVTKGGYCIYRFDLDTMVLLANLLDVELTRGGLLP